MQFDAAETSRTCSDRAADDSWLQWCRETLAPLDKDVVDIGCGGGIYSLGFAEFWIRSTLYDAFPRLLTFEKNRRPSRSAYSDLLEQCGFGSVTVRGYQEVRRTCDSFDELRQKILARKGKSASQPLVECDLWTVWMAHQ